MRKSQIFFKASISPEYSPTKKNELEKVYRAISDESEIDKVYKYLDQLTEVESQIMALLTQINDYYNASTYNNVYALLKPHLDSSNDNSNLHIYDTLTPDQVDSINPTFRETVMKEGQKFDSICDAVIKHLMQLLS